MLRKKLLLMPVLMVAAVLVAGTYGALQNQISYTVSPEYFHDFKFIQFRILEAWHGRSGAALVGFFASWWMGIVIGLPVLGLGLVLPTPRDYAKHCLLAMGVVMATTLAVGLLGLAIGTLATQNADLSEFWFPDNVSDREAFARAGVMHDASYFGGILGIATGMAYLWRMKLQLSPRSTPATSTR